MKYLVTGGNGFIGSHLVDKLIETNNEVCVIDNLSGLNDTFYYNERAVHYKENICNFDFLNEICKNIDIVFHLAAESRIQPSIENPLLAAHTNSIGTVNVLQAAVKNNVKRVIYSSTSSVYGLTDRLPTDENTPIDCLNPYSTSKYTGEEYCKMYSKLYDLDTCIFRYFNVYGERSPTKGLYSPVVGLFLKQNKENNELQIMGDGSKKRDFIHVSDVVNANILAADHKHKINGNVFNIGSGENHSILDIAKYINKNIKFNPPRLGEAENTLANINKAKSILGWEPLIDIYNWIGNKI